MKTYYVQRKVHWDSNGCDCCERIMLEDYNCPDIPHTMTSEEDVYFSVYEKETGVCLYSEEELPTQDDVWLSLLAMNVIVDIDMGEE